MACRVVVLVALLGALAACGRGVHGLVQEGGGYHVPMDAVDSNGVALVMNISNGAHMNDGITRKEIYDEAGLRKAMLDPFINEVWLYRNLTLSGAAALPALKNLRRLTIHGKCGNGTYPPYGGTEMCTIDASKLSGIFDVYGPAHLTLNNMRLTRGNSKYGGALAVWFGYADCNGCILEDNQATRGGAFSNWHGEIRLDDTHLLHNKATYNGHAAYHWGGATTVRSSTIQGKPFHCMRASMETYWNDDAGAGHSI
mmetsp:Transcript_33312/g.81878  ORF Transcript_33312/g.81878 Transcript_33312/m.81878 type:complete len:255 (-) Transcript_33312:237-1001(-)